MSGRWEEHQFPLPRHGKPVSAQYHTKRERCAGKDLVPWEVSTTDQVLAFTPEEGISVSWSVWRLEVQGSRLEFLRV